MDCSIVSLYTRAKLESITLDAKTVDMHPSKEVRIWKMHSFTLFPENHILFAGNELHKKNNFYFFLCKKRKKNVS